MNADNQAEKDKDVTSPPNDKVHQSQQENKDVEISNNTPEKVAKPDVSSQPSSPLVEAPKLEEMGKKNDEPANISEEERAKIVGLSKIYEKANQADVYLDLLQHTRADYENYQKRVERDRATMIKYAGQPLLQRLLAVLELFEKVSQSIVNHADKNIFEGIQLVYREFWKVFQDFGVQQIEALGKRFDPLYHEAVQMAHLEDQPDFTVVGELEKGYLFYDRVLRASKVIVNRIEKKQEKPAETKDKTCDGSK